VILTKNTPYTISIGDFSFYDFDCPPNAMVGVVITTTPTAGSLTDNGLPVTAGQFLTVFDISGGRLVYTPPPSTTSYQVGSFTFQVRDNGGTANGAKDTDPDPKSFTFLNPGPYPSPEGSDKSITTSEDTSYVFARTDFYQQSPPFNPPPGPFYPPPLNLDNLVAIKLTTLPNNGALRVNGVLATAGMYVPAADLAGGNLEFLPFPSASGSPYASFTFQVKDDGGTANGRIDLDPTPNTISVNVLSVNDPPSGKDSSVSYVYSGSPGNVLGVNISAAALAFTDLGDFAENALRGIKITTLPMGGVLTRNGNPVVAGDIVPLVGPSAEVLHYQPTVVGSSYLIQDSFKIQVQDDGGTANGGMDLDQVPKTMSLYGYVAILDDAPVAPPDRFVTMREDNVYAFSASDFDFTAPQDGNSVQSIVISSVPYFGSLRYAGAPVGVGMTVPVAGLQQGWLQFAPYANGNGPLYSTFGVSVQDTAGNRGYPYTIGFNVLPVNDAPIGLNSIVTTTEDRTYTFGVSDFGFADYADSPPNNFYTVRMASPPTAGLLTCGGVPVKAGDIVLAYDVAAGKLQFTPSANESGRPYSNFSFKLQDDGGTANGGMDIGFVTNTITINVLPVNDPPIGQNRTVTALEDTPYVFSPSDFPITDPIDTPPNSLFAIRIHDLPTGGTLLFNGSPVLVGDFIPSGIGLPFSTPSMATGAFIFQPNANWNGSPVGKFGFQVQDDGGTANVGVDLDPVSHTVTINVTPVNDPPQGNNGIRAIYNDAAYPLKIDDFGFSDPHDSPADHFKSVIIVSPPPLGTLTDGGLGVGPGQIIPVGDISNGQLVFTPAPGVGARPDPFPYTSFTFQVQDDGGTANGGSDTDLVARTLQFDLFDGPSAPRGDNNSVTTLEDQAYAFTAADFKFSDPNDFFPNNFLAVKITTLPVSGMLTSSGFAVATGDFVSVAEISAGRLLFYPAMNARGSPYTSFTFQVKDDGGTASGASDLDPVPRTMTIYVAPVCGRPVFGIDKTVNAIEDIPYVFSAADLSPLGADISMTTITISSLPSVGFLTDNGTSIVAGKIIAASDVLRGLLQFTPPPDSNGAAVAKFDLQTDDGDGCGLFELGSITINVTPVNDPPVFAMQKNANATDESGPQTIQGWVLEYSTGPADEIGQKIQYKVLSNSNAGLFTVQPAIDPGGTLTFTPAGNVSGSAIISVVAIDDGGTANGGVDISDLQTLTINVAKAHVGHNAIISTDVTGDGHTAPDDAVAIINYLNAFGSQRVSGEGEAGGLYYDVNADGFISPSDALAVINWINAFPEGEGQAAGSQQPAVGYQGPDQAAGIGDLVAMLAADVVEAGKKKR
jgi:hypothetical protein